ncbi:MAG: acetyltransferase [Candidatus Cloacimonetes bacterium]|nr:acetyltransferase [Candidatus Cloacimonadota bacterium]
MKKSKKAIIFGTNSFAEMVYYYLSNDSEYEVVAFTVSKAHINDDVKFGLPVVPFESVQGIYTPLDHEMYVAIAYVNMNKIRQRFYNEAKGKGYNLLTYISSKASIYTEVIGDNCFIFEDNTLQPYIKLGNNIVLWSGNHIGHHSTIEDHCFIASHAVISGHCVIKENSFIGVNATIRDSVIIEKENIIGAGAVILKNTKEKEVYAVRNTELFPKSSDQVNI